MRVGEVVGVVGGVGVDVGLDAVGQVVGGEGGQGDLLDGLGHSVIAADAELARRELDLLGRRLQHGRGDHLGLSDDLLARAVDGYPAHGQRP